MHTSSISSVTYVATRWSPRTLAMPCSLRFTSFPFFSSTQSLGPMSSWLIWWWKYDEHYQRAEKGIFWNLNDDSLLVLQYTMYNRSLSPRHFSFPSSKGTQARLRLYGPWETATKNEVTLVQANNCEWKAKENMGGRHSLTPYFTTFSYLGINLSTLPCSCP